MDKEHLDRTLKYALELSASPQEVWNAIATADGLKSWFSYDAKVTPSTPEKDGSVWLAWGDDFAGEAPITVWDPPRHLQSTEHRAPYGDDSIAPVDVSVDYFIEAKGGKTILRLVHSGMGSEKGWDGEYHATAEDWPWFLANLQHIMEVHPGVVRDVFSIVVPFPVPGTELWSKLFGMGSELGQLRESMPYDLRLFGREAMRGVVKLIYPGRRFMGTISELDDAMFVMTVTDKGDTSKVAIELSTYGLEEPRLNTTKRNWCDALRELGGTIAEELIDA